MGENIKPRLWQQKSKPRVPKGPGNRLVGDDSEKEGRINRKQQQQEAPGAPKPHKIKNTVRASLFTVYSRA